MENHKNKPQQPLVAFYDLVTEMEIIFEHFHQRKRLHHCGAIFIYPDFFKDLVQVS